MNSKNHHNVAEEEDPDKILVVEDDESLRILIHRKLNRAGFSTEGMMKTTLAATFDMTPSQIAGSFTYDNRQVEVSGQVFNSESGQRLMVDGKTGINLTGNIAGLFDGIYKFKGYYNTDTNTLKVARVVEENVFPTTIDFGKTQKADLVPVQMCGLVASPPKYISNTITHYLSIPCLPDNLPVYPYVVFTEEGLYLSLSDTEVELPAKFNLYSRGKDCSFTFSACAVKGVLLKTPSELISLGAEWIPNEFQGIIIADNVMPLNPTNTTVREITTNPDFFIFKRVSIQGSYLITTATIDYSDIQAPIGQGILVDEFSDLFGDNSNVTLETIDPEATAWQFRDCWILGTVIYPTEEILKYLDYSQPLSQEDLATVWKPALIVDNVLDDIEEVADISQLNPITGNPSVYRGKVVEFEGYAIGISYPLKQLAKVVVNTDVPVNVNMLAVGIADGPLLGSQLVIIGLNNDLLDEQGEVITGKFRFRVAVSHVTQDLVSGFPGGDTAFFLLSKEEIPEDSIDEVPIP